MARGYHRKQKAKKLWVHAAMSLVVCYFVYHSFAGRNGMVTLLQLQQQVQTTQKQADELTYERVALEHRINRLSHSIDLDLLDEEARRQLGYVGKGEHVIYCRDKW